MGKHTLENIGLLMAETAGFGPLDPPEWIGLGVNTKEKRAIVALPTLQSVEIAAAHLAVAQKQAEKLPPEMVRETRQRHRDVDFSSPVNVLGAESGNEPWELRLDLGIGVMRLHLTDRALEELRAALARPAV